jgi:hypothetical protein
MNNKTINADYLSLYKGVNIPLVTDHNGDYLFKINKITTAEVNKPNLYIAPSETKNVYKTADNLDTLTDNTYKLEKPFIREYSFRDIGADTKGKYYPSDLSDEQVIDMFVLLIDSYNQVGNFSLLEANQYKVERNENIGAIYISLNINGNHSNTTFYGFKRVDGLLKDIDGSLDQFNLIASDINSTELRKLMVLNQISPYVSDVLNYEITPENMKGEAIVHVVSCRDVSISDLYVGKDFKVLNLQPMFIRGKKNINQSFFHRKASQVTINSFKENFANA